MFCLSYEFFFLQHPVHRSIQFAKSSSFFQMTYLSAGSKIAITTALLPGAVVAFAQTETTMPYKKTGSVYLVGNNGGICTFSFCNKA